MGTMEHATNQASTPHKRRGRKKNSIVWDHFTIETAGANRMRATCNQCKKSFAYISGSKQAGTSHLKRHIASGICPVGRKVQGGSLAAPYSSTPKANISLDGNLTRKRYQATNQVATIYSFGDIIQNLAKLIIQQEYPVNMVEQSGFIDFLRALNPKFSLPSADSVQVQILEIYQKEKQKLLDAVNSMSGHLSLSVDLWRSNQGVTYVLISGHFVDQDWKLQRRSFNFVTLEAPHSSVAFTNAVTLCLSDWKCDDKLLAVSIDGCHTDKEAIENIRSLFSIKNSLILNGQLLLKDCYACVLKNLALETLSYIRETVEKVRSSVKYVKASDVHEEMFVKLQQKLQIPCVRNLVIDDQSRWDTTYMMLSSACEMKEVFSCMDTYDDAEYKTISLEEWDHVKSACVYLKMFYNAANILTSPDYPTTNVFFHEVWNIHFELMNAAVRPDPFVSSLTRPLHERFSKYWDDCNHVLAVAVAMDPRFKMMLVNFTFSRIYGEVFASYISFINDVLRELYLEYVVQALPPPTFVQKESDDPLVKPDVPDTDNASSTDNLNDFDIYISDYTVEQQLKTELDQYLEEAILPRFQDFDVLGWWKSNASRYPTLSKLAVDVLSIPVSTLAGESVFETRQRRLSRHHSMTSSSTLQALICGKDWLQRGSSDIPFRINPPVASSET